MYSSAFIDPISDVDKKSIKDCYKIIDFLCCLPNCANRRLFEDETSADGASSFSFMEIQYASAHLPAIFYDASPFDFVCFWRTQNVQRRSTKKLAGTGRNVSSFKNAFLRDRNLCKNKRSCLILVVHFLLRIFKCDKYD